jgi:hypothetical protein
MVYLKKYWDTVGEPISTLPSQPFFLASPESWAFKEAIGGAQFSTLPSSPTVFMTGGHHHE